MKKDIKISKQRNTTLEIVWIAVIILALLFFFSSQFGLTEFFTSSINVNIKDTFIVMPKYFMFLFVATLTFFIIYSMKAIASKFKNAISNTVLLISILFFVAVLTYVTAFDIIASGEAAITGAYLINPIYFVAMQMFLVALFGFVMKRKTLIKFKM